MIEATLPTWYWLLVVFAGGTCIGSFLNVCIYRIPAGLSILWPPSHCPRCQEPIRWYENIPILSYLFLRGRCRHCGEPIPLRYPLVELLSGLLWLAAFWRDVIDPAEGGASLARFLAHGILFSGLIVASAIDLRYLVIPDSVTVPLMVAGLLFCLLVPDVPLRTVQSIVPMLDAWTPTARRWFTALVVALAVGCLHWAVFLWRRRTIPRFVGPADLVMLTAWAALALYLAAYVVCWRRFGAVPEVLLTVGQWNGWWTWVLGLLGGAASVWSFRLLGNGYLQLKRCLLAWRARQWLRRRRVQGRVYRRDLIPSQADVFRVILTGADPTQPWMAFAPWLAREALGFGDVTLMAAVGSLLGWQAAVLAFFIAPFYAIGFSLVRFILFGEREIPLGPFLAAAAVTVVLAWPELWVLVAPRAEALRLLLRLLFAG